MSWVPVTFGSQLDVRAMWKLLGRWCPGKKLDLGPSGSEWDDEAMISRPNGHGPGFVKGVVPMINAEASNLIGVDQ